MRLAITVDPLASQMGGIGRYTWELIKGLRRCLEVRGLSYYRNGRWIADADGLLRDQEVFEQRDGWWRRVSCEWRQRTSLFHGTNFFLPNEARRGVITIHDLSVLRFPELHPVERIQAYEREFSRSVAAADRIITPTEAIRQEVMAELGCAPHRVMAVPMAASSDYHPRMVEELTPVLASHGLTPGSYGLSVATIEPRKKLEQSLAAWGMLPAAVRSRYPLVLAGGTGWKNDTIQQRIEAAEIEGWVRNVGFFPEVELPLLYAGARVVLYPSTYEGFGLPAVEAMASGVPCLISPRSCLAEVTQGAAMPVDPDIIDDYARRIEQALTDESWREEAIRRGLTVAGSYTWERCVTETMAVYRQALTDGCRGKLRCG